MLYSIGKFANLIGVTPKTLRNWHKSGKLVPAKVNGKNRYYSEDQLEIYFNKKPSSNLREEDFISFTFTSNIHICDILVVSLFESHLSMDIIYLADGKYTIVQNMEFNNINDLLNKSNEVLNHVPSKFILLNACEESYDSYINKDRIQDIKFNLSLNKNEFPSVKILFDGDFKYVKFLKSDEELLKLKNLFIE